MEEIKELICNIRNKQVMLDSDLAQMYQIETKNLNRAVKRNIQRFPLDFCFQLTEEEYTNLRCQSGTSKLIDNNTKQGGRRYLPYAFTEQGIAMLSGVLHTDMAVSVSITIMNAFVEMRKFITANHLLLERVSNIELKQSLHEIQANKQFKKILDFIETRSIPTEKLFFNGQIYDAHSLIVILVKSAKSSITLIDGYIDNTILDLLTKKSTKVKVILCTYKTTPIQKTDIEKFNAQYKNLEVMYTNIIHDRFIIIDNTDLYHIGASIKDLGKKCFGINKIEDPIWLQKLMGQVYSFGNMDFKIK